MTAIYLPLKISSANTLFSLLLFNITGTATAIKGAVIAENCVGGMARLK